MKIKFYQKPNLLPDEIEIEISAQSYSPLIQELEDYLKNYKSANQILTIKNKDQIYRIPVINVLFFEVYGDYLTIHTFSETITYRQSLAKLSALLNKTDFVKISRSTIINLSYLERLSKSFSGTMMAHLTNGETVGVSRSCLKNLRKVLFEERSTETDE